MQAPKLNSLTSTLATVVLLVLGLLCTTRTSSAYSVPTSFTFQGYLEDGQFGDPVTTSASAPLPMKFTLIINGTNVWAASYTGVNVIGGSFTVNLGANDPGAQGIDPNTQQPLNIQGVLPITPALLSAVTNRTPVVVQVQVGDGQGNFDTLTPPVPVNSALFALKAETINGFFAHQLAKQDNNGDILDSNGDPVISSSGAWISPVQPINAGPQGPQGPAGPAGQQGNDGPQGQGFNFTGPWEFDNEYNPYDVVTFDGSVWVVNPDGEPDGENPEVDNGDWSLFAAGFSYLGTWTQQVYYFNDVVLYNGSLYIADGTLDDSGEDALPPNQDSSWSLYVQGFNFTGPFDFEATYFPGDVVFYNGSSYVDFGGETTSDDGTPDQNPNFTEIVQKGDTGQQGEPGPQGPAGPPTPSGARWVPTGMTAKALTAIGGEQLKTAGAAAGSAQPDAYYIQWSASGNKKIAGITGPFTQTKCQYHSVLNALIRTGSNIDNQRIWVAVTTADLSQSDGSGASTTKFIGLCYTTNSEGTDWQIASGDGTTASVQDSGVAVAANTTYHIRLDWTVDGQVTVTINGVSVGTKLTNVVIGDSANAGIECVTTDLGTKPVTTLVSHLSLVYDGNDF